MILRWLMITSSVVHLASLSHTSHSKYKDIPSPEHSFRLTGVLPKDHQVSIFLNNNESKRLSLKSDRAGVPISISITPCSSSIRWAVHFLSQNTSLNAELNSFNKLEEFTNEEDIKTFFTRSADIGQYVILVEALDSDTYVQIFGSFDPLPPHQSRTAQKTHMRLQKRLRKKRITVKWDQSIIDPHVTDYCLVISTRKNYTSLCRARGDRWGVKAEGDALLPSIVGRGRRSRERNNISKINSGSDAGKSRDVFISCVGARTHHTLDNLEHGKVYYFNLFAVNKETNLTFPYASAVLQYDQRTKQSKLKDGKPESVNLRKLDGKAVFKFKAGRQTSDALVVSVMPCGGAVDVDITTSGGKTIVKNKRIESYGKLVVPGVERGQRFLITVHTANSEELRRTESVAVLATTKHKSPLPDLPNLTDVRMLKQDCDSVTVGWFPSPDPATVRYCVVARENRKREAEPRLPDQCAIARRLTKSTDFHLMQCRDWITPSDSNRVMTQTVPDLQPGRRYTVQVTVQKSGGMTLSYDLLTLYTRSKCINS